MTLYHATEANRALQIEEEGLEARLTDAMTADYDEQLGGKGVYLFARAEDAEDFASDNCFDEYVIFVVDATDLVMIGDEEYEDGVSFITTSSIAPHLLTIHS